MNFEAPDIPITAAFVSPLAPVGHTRNMAHCPYTYCFAREWGWWTVNGDGDDISAEMPKGYLSEIQLSFA